MKPLKLGPIGVNLRAFLVLLASLLLSLNLYLLVNLTLLNNSIYHLNLKLFKVRREVLTLRERIRNLRSQLYTRISQIESSDESQELGLKEVKVIYLMYTSGDGVHLKRLVRWATAPKPLR